MITTSARVSRGMHDEIRKTNRSRKKYSTQRLQGTLQGLGGEMKTKDANEQTKSLPAVMFDELRFGVPSANTECFAARASLVTSGYTLPRG